MGMYKFRLKSSKDNILKILSTKNENNAFSSSLICTSIGLNSVLLRKNSKNYDFSLKLITNSLSNLNLEGA